MVRDTPAPKTMIDMILHGSGLRRHGPTHALRAWVPLVVAAPRRSLGYAVVASPRIWGRGARNAVHPHSSATC
jgi:hypothetical protein